MKTTNHIVLAGGSGFLGQLLAEHFASKGVKCVVLTRKPRPNAKHNEVAWDGETIGPWADELNGALAVVNLAGRSVDCRYNQRNQKLIMDSRVNSTRALGEAIRRCTHPPRVWLNSSTATIYRHTHGPAWDERGEIGATAAAKDAFSIEVAKEWERIFSAETTPQTRKAAVRSAMVLGAHGSVFQVLRRLVLFGLGGKMGKGDQFVSWIHEEDFCRAIEWIIANDTIEGPINVCAPEPLPNQAVMKLLREKCGRRFGLAAPGWLLEVGAFFLRTETELIIKSRRVIPARLIESGFQFRYPRLNAALDDLCARSRGL